MENGRNLK